MTGYSLWTCPPEARNNVFDKFKLNIKPEDLPINIEKIRKIVESEENRKQLEPFYPKPARLHD